MYFLTAYYLVCEAVRHWLWRSRDNALRPLKETRGIEPFLLAPPLRLHNQLRLAEGVAGGVVRGDRLDDDAVGGAEALRLRKTR